MLTFDELLKEYFFVRHLKPRTQNSYQGALTQFTKNMNKQGLRLASEVTQFHILTWRKKALSEIREVSWNCYVRHLRALYNFGIDQGLLNTVTNPFKGVTIREPKKPKKTLSKTQIDTTRAVLSQMVEYERSGVRSRITPAWFWQVVNETFYYAGLRLNQLVMLKVCDIDLENLIIRATVEGSKTQREYPVPISPKLKPYLEKLLVAASEQGFKDKDQLFNVNRFSEHYKLRKTMNHWQVSACYRKISEISKSKVSPHRFRHTLGTDLMKKPERNLHLVKDLLGHTSIKTTLEYVTTDVDMLRECVDCR